MSWTFQNVAVVGSGAVGLYFGGRLAEVGEDVRFLVRSDFEAISRNGLKVESAHGDFELPQVQAYQTAAEIGPVDLVIVAWKATANDQLATVLPPLLHPQTQVLTVQNGLGNCESLAAIVGPQRVLGGLCFIRIKRISPGRISHSGGEDDPHGALADRGGWIVKARRSIKTTLRRSGTGEAGKQEAGDEETRGGAGQIHFGSMWNDWNPRCRPWLRINWIAGRASATFHGYVRAGAHLTHHEKDPICVDSRTCIFNVTRLALCRGLSGEARAVHGC